MKPARWKRRLYFRSGPESHVFYACDEHLSQLEDGTMGSGCFFASVSMPVMPVPPEYCDEIECDGCREG